MAEQRLDVAATLQRDIGDGLGERLEFRVARDEVGLGVDLDDDAFGALHSDGDEAFSGYAAGLLGGLRQALGAQPVDGGFHVAVGRREGGLTIHHARAGLVAEFLHHRGGDRCHLSCPCCRCGAGPRAGHGSE